jgi:DNA (cytosine-5)-methyltransferase 1
LYLRAVRAAEVLQPRAVLIENVPGVVHDEGEVIAIAHRFLSLAGYQVRDFVIDSQDLGLPQTRRRHVLIALRDGEPPSTIARPAVDQPATLRDYIGDLVDEPRSRTGPFYDPGTPSKENKRRIDYLFDNGLFDLPNSQRPPCHRDRAHSYVSMYGRLRWDAPAGTITSGFGCMGQGRYVHPSRRRTLTPHEAARVQGFPDFYDFSDVRGVTSLREMIGNAVPPRLSAIVMDQLFHAGAFRYATC